MEKEGLQGWSHGFGARPSRPALPGCSLHRRLAAPAACLVGGGAARARGKCERAGSGGGRSVLALARLDQPYPVARCIGGSRHRRLAWSAAVRLARAGSVSARGAEGVARFWRSPVSTSPTRLLAASAARGTGGWRSE